MNSGGGNKFACDVIFHIAQPCDWEQTGEYYKPAGYDSEGFVHCSTRQQLLQTAQRYYPGRTDLLVLTIDVSLLVEQLVFENLLGGEMHFPHYYAEVPRSAVLTVCSLELASDGSFSSSALSI